MKKGIRGRLALCLVVSAATLQGCSVTSNALSTMSSWTQPGPSQRNSVTLRDLTVTTAPTMITQGVTRGSTWVYAELTDHVNVVIYCPPGDLAATCLGLRHGQQISQVQGFWSVARPSNTPVVMVRKLRLRDSHFDMEDLGESL